MYTIHLWYPSDLKPVEYLIGLIPALIATILLSRPFLRRAMRNLEETDGSRGRAMSRADIVRVMPRKIRAVFMVFGLFLLGFLFLTVPSVILIDSCLTAKLAIIEPDNRACTRAVFIWNKEYGALTGKGYYIVNNTSFPVVLFNCNDLEVTGRVEPNSVAKVASFPANYIYDLSDNNISFLPSGTAVAPVAVWERIMADSAGAPQYLD